MRNFKNLINGSNTSCERHIRCIIDILNNAPYRGTHKSIDVIFESTACNISNYYVTIKNNRNTKKISILFNVNDSVYLCAKFIDTAIKAC